MGHERRLAYWVKGGVVIPQAEEAICLLGQIIGRNVGKREFYVVHPDWTPWYERNSGTSKLERCRCQIAQSLVCAGVRPLTLIQREYGAFERF